MRKEASRKPKTDATSQKGWQGAWFKCLQGAPTGWCAQADNGKTHLQSHACPIGEFKWTSNCSIAKSKEEVPNKADGEKNLSTGCLHCDCGGEGQAKTIEASKRCSAEVDDRAGNSAKLGRMTAENRCVWLHHWNEKGLGLGLGSGFAGLGLAGLLVGPSVVRGENQ